MSTDQENTTGMKVAIARGGAESYVPGRRSYIRYRDHEVAEASGGRFGGTVHKMIEFADGSSTRIEAGDAIFIPGGVAHIESGASTDIEVIEYTAPAEIGTVECEPPPGWVAKA